jgi:hypothetical protein
MGCCWIQSRCRHLVRHNGKHNFEINSHTSKMNKKYIQTFLQMLIRILHQIRGDAAAVTKMIWGHGHSQQHRCDLTEKLCFHWTCASQQLETKWLCSYLFHALIKIWCYLWGGGGHGQGHLWQRDTQECGKTLPQNNSLIKTCTQNTQNTYIYLFSSSPIALRVRYMGEVAAVTETIWGQRNS